MPDFFWCPFRIIQHGEIRSYIKSHLPIGSYFRSLPSPQLTTFEKISGILRNLHPSGNSQFPECLIFVAILFLVIKCKWWEMDNINSCIALQPRVLYWKLCLTGRAPLARSHTCVNYSKDNKMAVVIASLTNRKWLSSCDKMFTRKCCYTIPNISCLQLFFCVRKWCMWCKK